MKSKPLLANSELIVNNESMMIKNLIIDWLMIEYDPQNVRMIEGYVVEGERTEPSEIYSVNGNNMYRRLGNRTGGFERKAGRWRAHKS